MVLSDRLGNKTRSPLARTLIYVAAFGLGSLFLSAILSWAMVGIAEGMLPAGAGSAAKDKDGKDALGAASAGARSPGGSGGPGRIPKPGSKAERPRGNESAPGAD
jgi:hypothetical protein